MKKLLFAMLFGSISFSSCKTASVLGEDEVIMYIASEQVDCVGVAPMKCMQVRNSEDSNWTYFYSNIKGFTYEPGYEYKLIVKKTEVTKPVPADASSISYSLVKEVKKIKK